MNRHEKVLSNEQMKRVIEEERLRLQVRSELERESKTTKGAFWEFVNSAFGIFLLSSVFVTGLGGLFTVWTQHNREKENRIREEKKMLAEFDFRLKELETRIAEIQAAPTPDDKGALTVYIWRAARGNSDYQPAVPEFKNVHWADIVVQLDSYGITAHASEAIAAIRDLEVGVSGGATIGIRSPHGYYVFPVGYLEAGKNTA